MCVEAASFLRAQLWWKRRLAPPKACLSVGVTNMWVQSGSVEFEFRVGCDSGAGSARTFQDGAHADRWLRLRAQNNFEQLCVADVLFESGLCVAVSMDQGLYKQHDLSTNGGVVLRVFEPLALVGDQGKQMFKDTF